MSLFSTTATVTEMGSYLGKEFRNTSVSTDVASFSCSLITGDGSSQYRETMDVTSFFGSQFGDTQFTEGFGNRTSSRFRDEYEVGAIAEGESVIRIP